MKLMIYEIYLFIKQHTNSSEPASYFRGGSGIQTLTIIPRLFPKNSYDETYKLQHFSQCWFELIKSLRHVLFLDHS